MPQIHQEETFAATPEKVYDALMRSEEHSKFTGAPAEVSGDEGGAFSSFGGHISGRNIALIPGRRVVQAWRAKTWPEGVYWVARFELSAEGKRTRLVFDQDGVPADTVEHVEGGWKTMYWEPLRKYLEG